MKIEITSEQFDKIQNEIIRIEDYILDNRDGFDAWEVHWLNSKMDILKEILTTEEIDLGELIH